MVVTHLFQVLSFVAIEPPTALAAEPLRDEKAKVYESMKPIDVADVVRGQYDGYRSEQGVNPDSDTETFVALKVEVDNWRWAGVPFYLRTGKSLGERRQTSRSASGARRCACSARPPSRRAPSRTTA